MTVLLRLRLQYARFGTVGATATVAHVILFTALIELVGFAPIAANFVAFCATLYLSFCGHFYWTFREQTASAGEQLQRVALLRFSAAGLSGLALNSLAVYLVVSLWDLPYPYAIALMVGVVPLLLFGLTKLWAFAQDPDEVEMASDRGEERLKSLKIAGDRHACRQRHRSTIVRSNHDDHPGTAAIP